MKTIKLLFSIFFISIIISSCSVRNDGFDPYYPTLEEVVTEYDLWYIDYNKTTGIGDVPFLSKAFTISFLNGRLYANNNIVGIGFTGDGYGVEIGRYDTFTGILEIDHILDGYYAFEVIVTSINTIILKDNYNNVAYYLEGYQREYFDYDKIFYENIEYFLQEYEAWEKSYVSEAGELNEFDNENFLAFTPENLTTFYSSQDEIGTDIEDIFWDYVGDYSVYNVQGYENLKILTLDYDNYGTEEFELSVINDKVISLFHNVSGTTYEFTGKGFIQYLKPNGKKDNKDAVRIDSRKRTKVNRETKIKRN
jgi:hypothetical protein